MKTFINSLFTLFILVLSASSIAMDAGGGGGGGPNFSNSAPGNSSSCGSGNLSTGTAVPEPCLGTFTGITSGDVGEYEDCRIYLQGATLRRETCTCIGSMENNIWSEFCAPATGTYDFEVGAISCTGGGGSLQFVIWDTDGVTWSGICDIESYIEFCDNSFTSNTTFSVDLTSGTCYTLMFDGNAGADCSWDFNINCSTALGITLIDYSAKLSKEQDEVLIEWDIIDEYDISHYEIHRSKNGRDFEKIGGINSHNVGEERYLYSFTDNNPANGLNYYKLVQIENDGRKYEYKNIVANKTIHDITIFPNPITSDLNISFGKNVSLNTEIKIYDILGNLVYNKELRERTNSCKIDLKNQEEGIYFLFIKDGDNIMQQKFYKE